MLKELEKNLSDLLKKDEMDIDIRELEKLCRKIVSYVKSEKKRKIAEYESQINYLEMVFVEGGKYRPSFFDRYPELEGKEGEVFDIEVGKYIITQKMYKNIMLENPSRTLGRKYLITDKSWWDDLDFRNKLPVTSVSWWDALEFCNKLSEKEGLKPVYSFEKTEREKTDEFYATSKYKYTNLKINQLDGKTVDPAKADFRKTEGYRLPLEIEWEWFARGGNIAKENGTFDNEYPGGESLDEVAWYEEREDKSLYSQEKTIKFNKINKVGWKKANELGLYDCLGNVEEWCYDARDIVSEYIMMNETNYYMYDVSKEDIIGIVRIMRGDVDILRSFRCLDLDASNTIGFRIVRTASKK